jgi:hypothetical protein
MTRNGEGGESAGKGEQDASFLVERRKLRCAERRVGQWPGTKTATPK